MEAVRDLGRVQPWEESLEWSHAWSGGRSQTRGEERPQTRWEEPSPTRAKQSRARSEQRSPRTRADRRPRPHTPNTSRLAHHSLAISTLTLLLAIAASAFGGGGARASGPVTQASAFREPLRAASAAVASALAHSTGPDCEPVGRSSGYANPVAHAVVKRERVDQGVDYAGSGTLAAIGAAEITYVGTSGTGWPGAFIEYRLLGGPDAGCFVYYAEGVVPAAGLRAGVRVNAGQPIARIIPHWSTGIEIGWGAGTGTKTYAAITGEWTATDDADSVASAAGKSFSALIAGLGGPPGKVEG